MKPKAKRFPFYMYEDLIKDADEVHCSSCKSSYKFSIREVQGQNISFLLYCRFTNTIYTVDAWAPANAEFRAQLEQFLLPNNSFVFSPTRHYKSAGDIDIAEEIRQILSGEKTAKLITSCPYCGGEIPSENWSVLKGWTLISRIADASFNRHKVSARRKWLTKVRQFFRSLFN